MSNLKVYWPESESAKVETIPADQEQTAEPGIYSFAAWVEKLRRPDTNPAMLRARSLHANQACPDCRRVGVLPLMLNDGRLDGSGRMVPGSATLVGFRCEQCSSEWPA